MGPIGLTEARASTPLAAYARTGGTIALSNVRLATGERYHTAGEDVANVSSATRLQAQTSTLRAALVNGAHATSLLQVAYAGLDQIRSILESLSSLTNTTNQTGLTPRDYATLDGQFQSLKAAIDGIATTTKYNGATLLDGSTSGNGAGSFQLGYPASSTVVVDIPNVTSASLFSAPVSLSNSSNAASATSHVTTAQDAVNTALAKVAAYQSQLDSAEAATKRSIYGITNATNSLIQTDSVAETASLTHNHFQQQTASMLIAQTLGLSTSLLNLVR
jgi:flagellin